LFISICFGGKTPRKDGALNIELKTSPPSLLGEKWVVFPEKIGCTPYFISGLAVLLVHHNANFVTFQSSIEAVHPVNVSVWRKVEGHRYIVDFLDLCCSGALLPPGSGLRVNYGGDEKLLFERSGRGGGA